jgi:hypothetical protein
MKLTGAIEYYLLFTFIFFSPHIEGRHKSKFGHLHSTTSEENSKEVRHLYKRFRTKKQHLRLKNNKQIHKQIHKQIQPVQKKFNMHTLNRPFAQPTRSSKIGIVPLYKLPNENK